MKIVSANTNQIIAISEVAELCESGIKTDNYIIGIASDGEGNFVEELPSIYEVESVPEGVFAGDKWCYTLEKGFYISPIWEQKLEQETTKVIDEYTLQLMQEGLI